MRAVVIVLLQIPTDVFSRFRQTAILRSPDFLFLQAAMEPLDVAVAFRVVVSRPPMRDAQLRQRFHEPGRGELGSVVGGQGKIIFSASCGQNLDSSDWIGFPFCCHPVFCINSIPLANARSLTIM